MNEIMRLILFLPPQASTVARELDYLHYSIIITTMIGAVGVTIFAGYFALRYRASAHREKHTPPDTRPGHTPAGLPLWTEFAVIGFLISLFMLWWVIAYRQHVNMSEAPKGSLKIYVTAKQWMWSFAYPEGGATEGVLYVPVDRPVELLLSSRDVIHSFYVPEFRVKQDVVPGRMTSVWFEANTPGEYQLLCAEYCGEGHSIMRASVVVLSEREYVAMMQDRKVVEVAGPSYVEGSPNTESPSEPLSLAAMGRRVADSHGCFRCHTTDGTAHIGPTWARMLGTTVRLDGGGTIAVDGAYITESMMDPLAKIHLGFEPVMPSYQGRLTAAETGAIVEYIRSLRDVPVDAARSPLPLEGVLDVRPTPERAPPRAPTEGAAPTEPAEATEGATQRADEPTPATGTTESEP